MPFIPARCAKSENSARSSTMGAARIESRQRKLTLFCIGWMGYPMQIKVNFLCRDSILAAPIVLDLALFGDLAARAGMKGIQEWLSFYFKSPKHAASVYPEHDLFVQKVRLENNLRYLVGEELINYLGSDYTNE